MEEIKKRKAVYNREADKKWFDENKAHRNYLTKRSSARGFISKIATQDDLDELEALIKERRINDN